MKTIQSFLLLAVVVVFASCSGSFQKTKSGLLYKIIADGKGAKVKPGSYIKFNIIVKQKDSVTYNSYGKIPAYTMVDSVSRPYDLSEVFPKLKEGDSAVVVQLADSIAKQQMGQMPPGLKKGDKITFTFRIVKVFNDLTAAQNDVQKEMDEMKAREIADLEKYVKSKGINNAVKTDKGVFVQIINPGTGAKPDSGKQVSIMYTGTTLDGKKFDSNIDTSFGHAEPLQFVIGQMGMIPGFEDAAKLLMKGGKAKAFIPSMLAYGMQGRPPMIKPFESLVFEMELIDITDAPKQTTPALPQAPAAGGQQ
jgi:FKBP-type peptidyl-prolyl cis-trans isomerase FkpA